MKLAILILINFLVLNLCHSQFNYKIGVNTTYSRQTKDLVNISQHTGIVLGYSYTHLLKAPSKYGIVIDLLMSNKGYEQNYLGFKRRMIASYLTICPKVSYDLNKTFRLSGGWSLNRMISVNTTSKTGYYRTDHGPELGIRLGIYRKYAFSLNYSRGSRFLFRTSQVDDFGELLPAKDYIKTQTISFRVHY